MKIYMSIWQPELKRDICLLLRQWARKRDAAKASMTKAAITAFEKENEMRGFMNIREKYVAGLFTAENGVERALAGSGYP